MNGSGPILLLNGDPVGQTRIIYRHFYHTCNLLIQRVIDHQQTLFFTFGIDVEDGIIIATVGTADMYNVAVEYAAVFLIEADPLSYQSLRLGCVI